MKHPAHGFRCSPDRFVAALVVALAVSFAAIAGDARAQPTLGGLRPDVELIDAWDRTLHLPPDGTKPVLFMYEDKDSAAQNQPFKDQLSDLAQGDRYQNAMALVAVADLVGYDYWPVRGFVKSAIREQSQKFKTVIYCDWDGSLRSKMGFQKGSSNVVFYGRNGKVMFSSTGPMTPAARSRLVGLMRQELGG